MEELRLIGAIHAPAEHHENENPFMSRWMKSRTIPLSGGERAVRPWGGLMNGTQGLLWDPSVQANWIRLDDIYIGTWLEEGIDYLFKFRLSIEATEA